MFISLLTNVNLLCGVDCTEKPILLPILERQTETQAQGQKNDCAGEATADSTAFSVKRAIESRQSADLSFLGSERRLTRLPWGTQRC